MRVEKLVTELRKIIRFKETTAAGDVVLIAGDNPSMLVYGLVDAIEPDTSRSGQWWHVRMKMLSIPPREIVWTLREPQFTGREIFTMGGDQRFLQAVHIDSPVEDCKTPGQGGDSKPGGNGKGLRRLK